MAGPSATTVRRLLASGSSRSTCTRLISARSPPTCFWSARGLRRGHEVIPVRAAGRPAELHDYRGGVRAAEQARLDVDNAVGEARRAVGQHLESGGLGGPPSALAP